MRKKQSNLKVAFWYIALVFCIYFTVNVKVSSPTIILGGLMILVTVLYSGYLWIARNAYGLPIFPIFSFTFIFKYALPVVSNSLMIRLYTPGNKFYAAFTATLFLLAGIISWSYFLYKKPHPPKRFLSLPDNAASINTFLAILSLDLILRMNQMGNWFYLGIALQNFLELVSIGTGLLAVFFLSYRWGTGELKKRKFIFLFLFAWLLVASAMNFYLIDAMTVSIAMVAGYFLGSKRIPVILILLLLFPIFFLQYGKATMREKYWNYEEHPAIQPWQYPSLLGEWFEKAVNEIGYRQNDPMYTSHVQPLLERSSMIQLLLMVQTDTPDKIPYFQGATYAYILESMMPRFLNPQKVTPLIGGRMLSVRYGVVPEDQVDTTAIAWDIFIESYANFGLVGCIVLGFLLGGVLGYVEYWSAGLPILSFRFLYASIILLFAFKSSEMVLNTIIVSLLQTTVGLVLMAFFLMRVRKIRSIFGHHEQVPSWMRVKNQGLDVQ